MAWEPDYVTTEEIRAYREIDDVGDDTEFAVAVTAASREIDRFCNRQFGVVDGVEARRYTAVWNRRQSRWVIRIDDLMDATGLVIEFDTSEALTFTGSLSTSEVDLWDPDAVAKGKPWDRIAVLPAASSFPQPNPGSVRVTALWGWTAVPVTVKQATLLQASRLLGRRRTQFGEGGPLDPSIETQGTWAAMRYGPAVSLDPEVRVMLGKYRRLWGMVS